MLTENSVGQDCVLSISSLQSSKDSMALPSMTAGTFQLWLTATTQEKCHLQLLTTTHSFAHGTDDETSCFVRDRSSSTQVQGSCPCDNDPSQAKQLGSGKKTGFTTPCMGKSRALPQHAAVGLYRPGPGVFLWLPGQKLNEGASDGSSQQFQPQTTVRHAGWLAATVLLMA